MMIRPAELKAIKAGTIDLAFRRWDRPRVRVGTHLRTSVGVLEVTSVAQVAEPELTDEDASRAGATSVADLQHRLAARPDRPVFRIGLRWAGRDPRERLREQVPDAAEAAELLSWLDRLDRASRVGPWTRPTLELIDARPGVRAPDLASTLGRPTEDFKRDVRKLKEKGLTESLDIGYRLSPRGEAVLDHAHGADPRQRPARHGTSLPQVGATAARALRNAGITTLEQVASLPEDELAAIHGVGPVALGRLRAALADG